MGIVTRLNPMGGTLKFYFFQINPTPIQSNVVINGAETRRVIEKSGTVINWRVSLSAHSAQEGVIILTENTILNVELPQTQYQKLKIIPEPADSLVLINNVEQREIIVEFGTELVWSVSRNGYLPQNGSIELIDDVILDIKLVKEKY